MSGQTTHPNGPPCEPAPSRSMSARPDPYIHAPISKHTHTAILLHGLGNNGEKFGSELLRTGISSAGATLPDLFPGMKFIFPTAKRRRSSAFKRTMLTQWFDIACLEDPEVRRDLQIEGLTESAAYLMSILQQELQSVPPQNIILGGLSQGCAMGLSLLFTLDFPVGGFIGMCGYLPYCNDICEILSSKDQDEGDGVVFDRDSNGDEDEEDPVVQAVSFVRDNLSIESAKGSGTCVGTPVFMGHGEEDEKVGCKLGKAAADVVASLGMDLTWKSYPGVGHWYKIPDEIDDIVEFLQSKVDSFARSHGRTEDEADT